MTNVTGSGQAKNTFIWLAYGLMSVWLAVAVAWSVYARFDYGYGLWYQALDIDRHIERYAPHNTARPGFAGLSPAEHHAAFHAIRVAVHAQGEGLEEIHYRAPDGASHSLLNEAEVEHLQDVAHLLRQATLITLGLIPVWLAAAWLRSRHAPPAWPVRLGWTLIAVLGVVAALILIGPTRVFYAFHEWLFPPDHQWFFYWEESLMSTLMKAPDLFGAIAAVLAAAGLALTPILYLAGIMAARRIQRR